MFYEWFRMQLFQRFRKKHLFGTISFPSLQRRFTHDTCPTEPKAPQYANPLLSLKVELVGARELVKRDRWLRTTDPYAILQVGLMKKKSSVQEDTLNPIWGETFFFTYHPESNLEITIFDSDMAWADDVLGYCKVQMKKISEEMKKSEEQGLRGWNTWFLLETPPSDPSKYVQGRLYINFDILDVSKKEHEKTKYSNILLPHPIPIGPPQKLIKNVPNPWWNFANTSSGENLGPPNRKYRILSLDGGGVRGILSSGHSSF